MIPQGRKLFSTQDSSTPAQQTRYKLDQTLYAYNVSLIVISFVTITFLSLSDPFYLIGYIFLAGYVVHVYFNSRFSSWTLVECFEDGLMIRKTFYKWEQIQSLVLLKVSLDWGAPYKNMIGTRMRYIFNMQANGQMKRFMIKDVDNLNLGGLPSKALGPSDYSYGLKFADITEQYLGNKAHGVRIGIELFAKRKELQTQKMRSSFVRNIVIGIMIIVIIIFVSVVSYSVFFP